MPFSVYDAHSLVNQANALKRDIQEASDAGNFDSENAASVVKQLVEIVGKLADGVYQIRQHLNTI